MGPIAIRFVTRATARAQVLEGYERRPADPALIGRFRAVMLGCFVPVDPDDATGVLET